MSPADFLLTVAEIAVAFVGFSALVMVFLRAAGGADSQFRHLQVASIIQIGSLALLLSLLPLLLGLLPVAETWAWRGSSLLFAVLLGLSVVSYRRRRADIEVPSYIEATGYAVRGAATFLVLALQLVNAALVPADWVAGVYCLGVVALIAFLCWMIFTAWQLWGRPEEDEA